MGRRGPPILKKQAMISMQGMADNGLVLSCMLCILMNFQFFYLLFLEDKQTKPKIVIFLQHYFQTND